MLAVFAVDCIVASIPGGIQRINAIDRKYPGSAPMQPINNPILSCAAAAVANPEGCRVAILDYGAILGWPVLHAGPLQIKEGEENWREAVARTEPLWLGAAWQKIEFLEHAYQLDQEDKRQANKEKEDVTVLQWTESGKGLEPGDYPAIITDIEETTGEFGPQFQFQFVILDADGEQTDDEIRGWASQKWGEKTKLYKWSQAILGKRCPKPGEPMDTAKLLNKRCDLRVQEKMSSQPGGGMRSSIADIFPYQTVSKAAEADDGDAPF
jgi:hypothetical protein